MGWDKGRCFIWGRKQELELELELEFEQAPRNDMLRATKPDPPLGHGFGCVHGCSSNGKAEHQAGREEIDGTFSWVRVDGALISCC